MSVAGDSTMIPRVLAIRRSRLGVDLSGEQRHEVNLLAVSFSIFINATTFGSDLYKFHSC